MSSVKHLYVNWSAPASARGEAGYAEMKFGGKPKIPPAPKPVALPDPTDAAVRKRQADDLKALLTRRGRSSTLLSGRLGDQSQAPAARTLLGRGG